VVPVTSENLSEATVSSAALYFDSNNWSVAQSVTVTGVDDGLADGDKMFNVRIGQTQSSDRAFQNLPAQFISFTNKDRPLSAYQDFSINHILSTGQSNSVANSSYTVTSTTQP
jgi:hypothetical protein